MADKQDIRFSGSNTEVLPDSTIQEAVLTAIKRYAKSFNEDLQVFLDEEIDQELLRNRALYASNLIGQRERPFLVRVASRMLGGRTNDTMYISLAAELFMDAALTSDDVVDGSLTRGGFPAVWSKWDLSAGVLVAETLHALSHRALNKLQQHAPLESTAILEIVGDFQVAFRQCFLWQQLESLWEGNRDVNPQQCVELAYWRTGRLLELCVTSPAVLLGVDEDHKSALQSYGRAIGIAFQLRDDLIDVIGEEELIGKPVCRDLLNAQPNLVISHYHCTRSSQEPSSIDCYWGKKDSKVDQDAVIDTLLKTGSILFAHEIIQDYCRQAKSALIIFPHSPERDLLLGFADLIGDLPISVEP